MSDNYRVIRKVKDASLELKSKGWTNNGIANEIGISFALLNEIQEFDPVSVKVREGTMEKLREFLLRHEEGMDKPVRKKSGPKKKSKDEKPEFQVSVPESMTDAIPDEVGIVKGPKDIDGNLLNDLNLLAARFAGQGYRLSANIELIYEPE